MYSTFSSSTRLYTLMTSKLRLHAEVNDAEFLDPLINYYNIHCARNFSGSVLTVRVGDAAEPEFKYKIGVGGGSEAGEGGRRRARSRDAPPSNP